MKHQRLILIRHAHRDTEDPSLDNGLSEKGRKQVKGLRRFSEKRELNGAVFLSSPKKRCQETLNELARDFGQKDLLIEPMIGEGTSPDQWDQFIDRWKLEGPETLVICSHGDIIPNLVSRITGGWISIKKAGWCEIERISRDCYLTLLVQNVDQ